MLCVFDDRYYPFSPTKPGNGKSAKTAHDEVSDMEKRETRYKYHTVVMQHAHKKDFSTEDDQNLVKLARRIDELWQLLTINSPKRTNIPTENDTTQSEGKAASIADVPDQDILAS
jgi:hypothetical protein